MAVIKKSLIGTAPAKSTKTKSPASAPVAAKLKPTTAHNLLTTKTKKTW